MNICDHPDKPSVARCVVCGQVLCHDCRTKQKGKNFCWSCAPGKPTGFKSPNFSMLLSLMPGLGQMYTGSFLKGLLFMVFALTGAGLAGESQVPAILPVAFWLYSMWDARMSALKRNFKVTRGRSGAPGASEADWMLVLGTTVLGGVYLGLPIFTGVTMEPWSLWVSFFVVLTLSALIGRGGKDVKRA